MFLPPLFLAALAGADATPQQILLERCVACHGPDKHKGDLRLDQAASAARVLVPGKPEESELFKRLLTQDTEERMPKGKPPLPATEIEILRAWIAAGAVWPDDAGHWAYRPVAPAEVPKPRAAAWIRNPIDAFVLARLEAASLEPQIEADARTLLRRLSLDLTGLPPTLEEARSTETYEHAVDRLLASPHFGERWALPWLDLARYADTNGYEKDSRRTNWAWRDWVIDAFNADMPFDRFTIEQLAGDLLPNASDSQRIATGFQRNTLVNQEGGTDPEEFRYAAVVDRTNTAASVWLGSTLGCAQCHNHKYDPFSQRDYYRMLAFFDQSADTGNAVEPVLAVPSGWQVGFQSQTAAQLIEIEALLGNGDAEFAAEQRDWEARTRPLVADSSEAAVTERTRPVLDPVEGWEIAGPFADAAELPAQPDWRPETGRARRAVRAITETQSTWLWRKRFHADAAQRLACSVGADDELRIELDGALVFEHKEYDPNAVDAHRFQLEIAPGEHELRLKVHNGGGAGTMFFDCTRDDALPGEIEAILRKAAPEPAEKRVLAEHFRRQVSPRGRRLTAQAEQLEGERKRVAAEVATTMVMQERTEKRVTHLHVKGAFLQLGEEVTPDTPACLPAMDPSWPKNRLGLALWLVDPKNPLVARVQVNRVWEQLFGRGLVATGEDFGTRGAAPTHPELLDWLAAELVHERWSLKQLLRTIVTSATYRQAAVADDARLERDPLAELLSRSPRTRLPGELLRDNALAIAGLLDRSLGGPSVFPPQPEGVWTPVYSDDSWMESKDGERLRRGLYTFWKRSSPYASFMLFDAPSREACCPRRARTDTPLQALALLNDPAFVECAKALGAQMQQAAGDERAKLAYGFERCTARLPEARELDALAALLARQDWTAVAGVLLNLDETLCRP